MAEAKRRIPVSLIADSSSNDNHDGRNQCNIRRGVNDVVCVCQRRSHKGFHDALLREGGGRYPSSSLLSPHQRGATVDHHQNMALSDPHAIDTWPVLDFAKNFVMSNRQALVEAQARSALTSRHLDVELSNPHR